MVRWRGPENVQFDKHSVILEQSNRRQQAIKREKNKAGKGIP